MISTDSLAFLCDVLKKFHIGTDLLDTKTLPQPTAPESSLTGSGIGELLAQVPDLKPQVIYKTKDTLGGIRWVLLLPPDHRHALVIGPYTAAPLTQKQVLEEAERMSLEPRQIKWLERHLAGIPVIADQSILQALVGTFAEKIWGGSDQYTVLDRTNDASLLPALLFPVSQNTDQNAALQMKLMEERYAYENELIQAVSKGLTHKADVMLSHFSNLSFEKRTSDPLRNAKNYCIIMNTLLRKAAEQGGVHPLYIDSLSTRYAQAIEELPSTQGIPRFMTDLFRGYSNLVKKHAINRYPRLIQQVMVAVDSDLTADLSLKALARANNVSPGYLSALFKKETGETLTDFVNRRRIHHAEDLLKNTQLQIQTIAQHCGILDVHYFAKLFRRYHGTTPSEFREKVEK